MLFVWTLSFGPVNALELGQINVESYLNEPLNANFTLGHIATDNLGDIILSLADQDAYKAIGLIRPHFLSKLKFKITADLNSRYIVHMSTQQRIREPILDILVKVTEKQSSISRLYTLMMDPREIAVSKQPETTAGVVAGIKKSPVNPVPKQVVTTTTTKKLVSSDSISMIAQNSELHKKFSVYQIMRAYYLLNKNAFKRGNINHLNAGVSLIVPDEELVSEVSRQKSINFVYSVSKNDPFKKQPVVTQPKVATQKNDRAVSSSQENIAFNKDMTVKTILQKTSANPAVEKLNQNMINDVKAWRTVSQEFKALSSVVEKQNGAMQEYSGILQNIDSRLEEKNVQLEKVNIRLLALETSSTPVSITDKEILPGIEELIIPIQQKQYIQQPENIDEAQLSLTKRLAEIDIINKRLDALENNKSIPVAEILTIPEVPEPPVNKVEQTKSLISQDSFNSTLTWGMAFIALLFLLIRELVWRRRLNALSNSKTALQNETMTEKVDDVSDDVKELPISDEKAEVVNNVNVEVPVVSNLKQADQKFQLAVSNAREYKQNYSTKLHNTSDEEKDPQILYAEIDVLIAYQLYEEALELVENSRETFKGNNYLDIRELEILGYLMDVDLFFPKFIQHKDILSNEFPEEWQKIVELSKQMKSGPHLTAAI